MVVYPQIALWIRENKMAAYYMLSHGTCVNQ